MIQKFLCWLFGHKTLYESPEKTWEISKFCLRCGKEVDSV